MDRARKLNIIWQNSPSQPLLANKRVHVWRANLDLPTTEIERLAAFLSTDEIARANKFHFLEHKRRFIVARGILRQLLGNYLQISPNKIEFEYSDRGKPRLAASMGNSYIQFNVSHSMEYVLYGFTNNHLIGVDLEFLRETQDAAELAKSFFTHREYELIANSTDEERQKAFFQFWTAKEAYLKAIGTGLSDSLSDIEITFDCAKKPKLLSVGENIATVGNWSIYHFIPAANYVAAIIVNTQIPKQQINFWNW